MKVLRYLLVGGCLLWSMSSLAQPPSVTSMKALKMSGIERQTQDYSCGAAALSILLTDYFDDPLDELTLLTDMLSRLSPEEVQLRISDGFSMLDMKQQAERLGYMAEGILLPQESVQHLAGPVIILVQLDDLKHFVVLKGITAGRAYLADPARGNLRIPLYELLEQWKGETLVLGRADIGLPKYHGLALPTGSARAPETDVVRSLKFSPIH
ncbi:C39 family peptidase [Nitrincola sp. MINF-07-Sa-05]|uniref:C39 family peptidase n=1 Tax=Nitrincola salilacus TaxID=3400273 RepID=UPI003917F59C